MKKLTAIILSLIMIVTFVLPVSAFSSIAVKGINLDKNKITLKATESYKLKIILTPANTTQKTLTFVTSNKNVATIDATGTIKAIAAGTATITVYTYQKKFKSSCVVTVTPFVVKQDKLATPQKIRFWNGWTGPDGVLLKKLVDEYNAKNKDNVTVEMDVMQLSALTEKMNASLASNTNPELYLGFANGEYTVKGQVVAIDDIWEKTKLNKADFVKDVMDNMYYDGHLYGLPFQISSKYMYWNKDLFKAAGLDPETPPKTWAEVQVFSNKITNKAKNIYGGGFTYNDGIVYSAIMLSYGGAILSGTQKTGFNNLMNDPASRSGIIRSLAMMKGMIDDKTVPIQTTAQNEAAFFAGTLGMLMGGAWDVAGAKKANMNFGISLMPAGSNGIKQVAGPIAMTVMKGTKGDKKLATYKFMEYWNNNTTPSIAAKSPVYQWSENLGYQPYLYSVASSPALTSDPIFKVTNSYVKYLARYYPVDFWNNMPLNSAVVVPMLENVLTGRKTAEAGIDEAAKKLQEIIDDMKDY